MKIKNINDIDLGYGVDQIPTNENYDILYDFLEAQKIPKYLKSLKSNFKFTYANGTVAVPNINERLEDILTLNNLLNDKIYIQKRLRKVINEKTKVPRKLNKIKLISNARKKQCNLYKNNDTWKDEPNDYCDDYQLKDKQMQILRKSSRIKKKATKYNPYTGKSQIVGSGKLFLRK